MRFPLPLNKGDKIAWVAPARKLLPEDVISAKAIIEDWGYQIREAPNLYASQNQFAGSDDQRAQDFQQMIDSPEIKAIMCVRGGYGSARILDLIDFSNLKKHPKWIIGYSDITAFHLHLNQNLEIASMHASMPVNFTTNSEASLYSIKQILEGKQQDFNWTPHHLNRTGTASGTLCGGNLSVIYSLMASPQEIQTSGKILFLEDLDEYLYHIDRMILNLKRAGKLEDLAGMIVGGMTQMNDNDIPFGRDACEIIAYHLSGYDYPVAFGFPAGHIADNRAVVMGTDYILDVKHAEVSLRANE